MNTRNTWAHAVCARAALILCLGILPASAQDPAVEADEDTPILIDWANFPMIDILNEYERMTGYRIVRDVSLLGATLSIQTTQPLSKEEAARFIEQSLLLNGFALIPAGEKTLKIIAAGGGKLPIQQGIEVYFRPENLPTEEKVVTFLMPFTHLDTEEATRTLTQIFPSNAYGSIVAIPQASALAVTDNTSVIHKMLELREKIDLPPSQIDSQTITLERADATEVAEALVEILGLDSAGSSASGGGGRGPSTLQAGSRAQGQGQPNPQGQRQPAASTGEGAQDVQPKIRAIPRANRILVVARPVDMQYIVSLIAHFDEPVDEIRMVKHQLNYMSVSTFLPIVSHALTRGLGGENGQQQTQIAGGATGPQGPGGGGVSGSGGSGIGTGSGFGNTGSSRTSSGFSGGRSGFGGNSGGTGFTGLEQDFGPQSVVIDKTLLVADNVHNSLMVSGPAEHLRIIKDLLAELDQKPRQIRLTAIIAQLTLGDDFEYGFDLLRTLETQGINGTKNNGAGVFKSRTGALNRIVDIDALDQVDNFLPANQGLTLYGQINPYLNGYLHLLQETDRFTILSRPAVYTLNNRRASIFSGQRIAVPRTSQSVLDPSGGQVNNVVSSSIEFEEVILRIDVQPLINAEDNITLKIGQLNDQIVGTNTIDGNEIPIIGTQSLDTTVIVPDGGTVLLGGLISDSDRKSRSGLPLFFDFKALENVLGSQKRERDRQELLIFIQPKIIDNDQEMAEADAEIDERTAVSEDLDDFTPPSAKVRPVEVPPAKKKPKRTLFEKIFGIRGS